jgi:hypothetical protein
MATGTVFNRCKGQFQENLIVTPFIIHAHHPPLYGGFDGIAQKNFLAPRNILAGSVIIL